MHPEAVFYLFLTLVATASTFRARGDNRPLTIILGLSVLANWLLVQWTYASFAPQLTLQEAGLPIFARDLWKLFDGLLGLAAISLTGNALLKSRFFWPGWIITSLVICQELLHELRDRGFPKDDYKGWLDGSYLAMLLVLVAAGLTEGKDDLQRGTPWRSRRLRLASVARD